MEIGGRSWASVISPGGTLCACSACLLEQDRSRWGRCVCAPSWLRLAPTPPETLPRAQSGGRGTGLALSLEVPAGLDLDSQPQTRQVTELGPWAGPRLVAHTRARGSLCRWQEQPPWGQVTGYLVGQAALDGHVDGGEGAGGQPSHTGGAARARGPSQSSSSFWPRHCSVRPGALLGRTCSLGGPVVKSLVLVSTGVLSGRGWGLLSTGAPGRSPARGAAQVCSGCAGARGPLPPQHGPWGGAPQHRAVQGASAPALRSQGVAGCAEPTRSVPT